MYPEHRRAPLDERRHGRPFAGGVWRWDIGHGGAPQARIVLGAQGGCDGVTGGFQAVNVLPNAPAIGRLNSFGSGSFLLSGPVTRRLGMLAAGALTRSSRLERDRPDILASRTQSLSTHVVFGATPQDELRVFGQYDRTSFPGSGRSRLVDAGLQQDNRFTVLSSTWDHRPAVGLAWSANITHARATSEPPLAGRQLTATMERLRDGPVYELASAATSRRNRTYLSWRADPGPVRWLRMRHLPQFGVNASSSHVRRNAPGNTQLGELLYGVPARCGGPSSTGAPSEWSSAELALWAASQIALTRRFDLDIGLRAAATFVSHDESTLTLVARPVAQRPSHVARAWKRSAGLDGGPWAVQLASGAQLLELWRSEQLVRDRPPLAGPQRRPAAPSRRDRHAHRACRSVLRGVTPERHLVRPASAEHGGISRRPANPRQPTHHPPSRWHGSSAVRPHSARQRCVYAGELRRDARS